MGGDAGTVTIFDGTPVADTPPIRPSRMTFDPRALGKGNGVTSVDSESQQRALARERACNDFERFVTSSEIRANRVPLPLPLRVECVRPPAGRRRTRTGSHPGGDSFHAALVCTPGPGRAGRGAFR